MAAEAAVSDGVPVTGLRAAGVAAAADEDADAVLEAVRAADAAGEVGVAGAAVRVGGIGASPDPRSEASNIGDAQVPE